MLPINTYFGLSLTGINWTLACCLLTCPWAMSNLHTRTASCCHHMLHVQLGSILIKDEVCVYQYRYSQLRWSLRKVWSYNLAPMVSASTYILEVGVDWLLEFEVLTTYCSCLYMSSTITWLLWGAAPPLVVLGHARWRWTSELCSARCGYCHLLRSASPSPCG